MDEITKLLIDKCIEVIKDPEIERHIKDDAYLALTELSKSSYTDICLIRDIALTIKEDDG